MDEVWEHVPGGVADGSGNVSMQEHGDSGEKSCLLISRSLHLEEV